MVNNPCNLAILFSGTCHVAATRDVAGSIVTVREKNQNGSSSARVNAIATDAGRVWTGAAVHGGELASILRAPYVFQCAALCDFASAVVTGGGHELSSEAVLAVLVRRALADSTVIGANVDKVVLALDCDLGMLNAAALSGFLSASAGVPVHLLAYGTVFERFLQRNGAPSHSGMLAILQNQTWIGLREDGMCKALQVANHDGMAILRDDLLDCQLGAVLPAWSAARTWTEFVDWYQAGQTKGSASEPFRPYLLDLALRRRAISMAQAQAAVQRCVVPAIASMFGMLAGRAPAQELTLIGDDWLKLDPDSDLRVECEVKRINLTRIVQVLAADWEAEGMRGQVTADIGMFSDTPAKGAPLFHTLIKSGADLPALGKLRVSPNRAGQRQFRIQIGTQGNRGERVLLRELVFAAPGNQAFNDELEFQLALETEQSIRAGAIDCRTGATLDILSSKIPARAAGTLDGPESIANLALIAY